MTTTTKQIGTQVISTIGQALKIPVERFGVLLEVAKDIVNYSPTTTVQEEMAQEWENYFITKTVVLGPLEAAMVGAIVSLYLMEGILDQTGVEDGDEETEEQETFEGEPVYPTSGSEGWIKDSFRDVT